MLKTKNFLIGLRKRQLLSTKRLVQSSRPGDNHEQPQTSFLRSRGLPRFRSLAFFVGKTIRVLKENGPAKCGEYGAHRLVLEASKRLGRKQEDTASFWTCNAPGRGTYYV
jgi:hypothetical protein